MAIRYAHNAAVPVLLRGGRVSIAVQRRVVTSDRVPGSIKVIRHETDPVEVSACNANINVQFN